MNNDDTFKNTNNNNNNNDRTSTGLTPELEVRAVAWVLGEATPAEAAELARLAAENPALAEFKRRIEAVHGLVSAAARPVGDATLRLSDERRAKVLAVIGEATGSHAKTTGGAARRTPRWVQVWNQWALPMAACITLCVLLGAVMIPTVGTVHKKTMNRAFFEAAPKRPDPSSTVLGPSGSDGIHPTDVAVAADAPMVSFALEAPQRDESAAARGGFSDSDRVGGRRENAPAPAATMPVTTAAPVAGSGGVGEGRMSLSFLGYTGGTAVSAGQLELSSGEQMTLGLDARKPAAPAMPSAAPVINEMVAGSGDHYGYGSGMVQTNGALGASGPALRLPQSYGEPLPPPPAVASATRSRRVREDAGYVEKDKEQALGDVVFRDQSSLKSDAVDALKSEASKNNEAAQFDGFASAMPALPASSASSLSSTGFGAGENKKSLDGAKAASKPAKKRQTITITAGAPQEFTEVEMTESEQQDFQRRMTERRLANSLGDDFRTTSSKQLATDDSSKWTTSETKRMQDVIVVMAQMQEEKRKASARAEADAKNERAKLPAADRPVSLAFDESLRVETATNQQAVSTFSLHVSDASFRLAKAALARGEAPDPASIRPEEFYNAFDYGDPSPVAGEPVACRIEQSAHPFVQQRNLVRIAMKVPATGRGAGQPLRLTVLLDTSGSMEREDRAASVRAALTSLVSLLGPNDRITLIGFARRPRLLADRVPGNQAAGLVDIVARTPFEGGTNLEEALKLAGNLARGQFTAIAQNRIVLLTDGAANLGNDDPAQLSSIITALRQQGIAFDACGVGADGLDDTILEALTRKGDGRYTVINSPEEADAGFAKKLAGAFRPAAENVKVQVRFNPARVAHYRLIGFEQHRLKTEDFRNDRVDAAELAAEEAAVALYQVEVIPDGEGELGEVFVRFRDVAAGNMVERSWTLAYAPQPPAFDRATPSMKLAGTAAFLAEKLRGGNLAAQIRLAELAPVVNALRGDYAHDARVKDLATMFAQARRLTGE